MKEGNDNLLDRDDLESLDKYSSVFKGERERALIRGAVKKKMGSKPLPVSSEPGGKMPAHFAFMAAVAVITLCILIFYAADFSDNRQDVLQTENNCSVDSLLKLNSHDFDENINAIAFDSLNNTGTEAEKSGNSKSKPKIRSANHQPRAVAGFEPDSLTIGNRMKPKDSTDRNGNSR